MVVGCILSQSPITPNILGSISHSQKYIDYIPGRDLIHDWEESRLWYSCLGGDTVVLGRGYGCHEGGGAVEKCVWSRL